MKSLGYWLVVAALLAAGAGVLCGQAEELRITVGKSIVIDYPSDIARISTSNPDVIDAVAVTTREVLLHAKSLGTATIVVWSKDGKRGFYNSIVEHNLEPIRKILKETFPKEEIRVQAARDTVALVGTASSKDVADKALALVAPLAKTVVNHLQLPAAPVDQQVLLRVKFAELDRSASTSFGVNLLSTGALNTPAAVSTGEFSPPRTTNITGGIPAQIQGQSTWTLADALNIFAFRPDLNLAATIRALQSEGVLQILAEPNLVTTNGKEASFLVGGEFPVPVAQGGAASGAISVMFREFGIKLNFTPTITANKTIKMYVKPEVSTIDLANGVAFGGAVIPALATRRMETNIELSEGQSFVIGGLIDDRVSDSLNKIPGLSSIPILGALFKSRQDKKQKTELVVMVTPEIARPLEAGAPVPAPVMPKTFLPKSGEVSSLTSKPAKKPVQTASKATQRAEKAR